MTLQLRKPTQIEFERICLYINEFDLDNRVLKCEEFIAAYRENKLVGFGRLRIHADCIELCSLGVVSNLRRTGIGKAIVKELIKKAKNSVHLVCIIPDYFIPFGFQIVELFPDSMEDKRLYCTRELCVPEKYFVLYLSL